MNTAEEDPNKSGPPETPRVKQNLWNQSCQLFGLSSSIECWVWHRLSSLRLFGL